MKDKSRKKIVIVTGDHTIDWNLALFPAVEKAGLGGDWRVDASARSYRQRGGASLLADLVTRIADGLRKETQTDWEVRSVNLPLVRAIPCDDCYHHSHAVWSFYDGKEPAWRVKEFYGLSRRQSLQPGVWEKVIDDSPDADLVILDDADLGFRERPELWPMAVREKGCSSWILVKMSRPVARGALWEHLHQNCAERVIVVMTAQNLRRTEVQISQELSWERTALDLYWELTTNPQVNALSRCAHVIVSFDTAGAFLLSHKGGNSFECTLFFDPLIVEGMWNQAFQGGMIGYTSCLTGGIARQLMLSGSNPNLSQGIQSGLAAMRTLHQKGYTPPESKMQTGLAFPIDLIADQLTGEKQPFKITVVPRTVSIFSGLAAEGDSAGKEVGWAILQDRFRDNLEQVARNIVLDGVESALDGVPLGKFGKLITADRCEVESFRSIRSLIYEYCGQTLSKPLSIAVFGPPGSGKSFAVKQIAASLRPEEIKNLEFNLSQLRSVEDLHDAFHQVRDVALAGKMPMVFWDEFDSIYENQQLGWLRYFLAPMQDGAFQEGQIVHPIGRCVFVFAGGTCSRMEEFTAYARRFTEMKGPDFVSRLKGYVNILGPNTHTTDKGSADPNYLIRRAIILRVILQSFVPQILNGVDGKLKIDRGVLRALLHISEYKHGVRSIESIISMSSLVGKTSFERSSLPPETQLDLHVDGREFLSQLQQLELEGDLLEKLAEAAHVVFYAGKERDGWKLGPRDDTNKTHPLLKPYVELDEIYKEANRVTVRNIPTKLAAAGYAMVPARSDEEPINFPDNDLEKLAKMEHDLYVKARLEQGFTLGEATADNPRRNPYLVEWDEVPEEIKVIDRNQVKEIPKILAKAGYAVVKLSKDE